MSAARGAAAVKGVVARSIAQATKRSAEVTALAFNASADLVCRNVMCEHLGEPCVCRLARVLERTPQVEHVDLSDNGLNELPAALWTLKGLKSLDLTDNVLTHVPEGLKELPELEELRLAGNPVVDWSDEVANFLEERGVDVDIELV